MIRFLENSIELEKSGFTIRYLLVRFFLLIGELLKKKNLFFVVFRKYVRNNNLYNIFLQDVIKRKISQICRQLQLPRLHFPTLQIFNYGNQKTFVVYFRSVKARFVATYMFVFENITCKRIACTHVETCLHALAF